MESLAFFSPKSFSSCDHAHLICRSQPTAEQTSKEKVTALHVEKKTMD